MSSPERRRQGSPAPPVVSVIVPVKNAKRFLEPCIGSVLAALEACPGELILIDNGSTDGSYEHIRSRWSQQASIHLLPGPNVGGVRNYGVKLARADVLSFIDADCVVPPDYFVRALEVLERTGAAATGSRYALPDAPHWVERTWQELHDRPGEKDVAYLNAGNFFCRRSAFEEVSGFDEAIITGEDAELGERLRAAGHRIFEARSVIAVHLGNPKSLGHFVRKQYWHGLGMFGTFRIQWLDKPLLMTFAHILALLAVPAVLVVRGLDLVSMLLALALFWAVPAAAVVYRMVSNGTSTSFFPALLLYHLYFDSRITALIRLPWEHRERARKRSALRRGAEDASVGTPE